MKKSKRAGPQHGKTQSQKSESNRDPRIQQNPHRNHPFADAA